MQRVARYLRTRNDTEVIVVAPHTPGKAPKVDTSDIPTLHAGTLPIFRLIGRDEYSVGMPIGRAQQDSLRAFAPHVLHITSPDMLGFSAVSWARAAGSCSVCSFHTQVRENVPSPPRTFPL